MDEIRIEKLSQYCRGQKRAVIPAPNVSNIYQIPLNFESRELQGSLYAKSSDLKKENTNAGAMD